MSERKIEEPRLVLIKWQDVMSYSECGLMDLESLENLNPPCAYIVGYLVKEDDKGYYIAKEWWDSEQFKYLHYIPKSTAILEIHTLVKGKKVVL
jgi:hypothetical protein